MSRSRNIKPGFFKNEELSELPFEYRILFQGLWCEADREGRLEDRPKRLKAEIFPYDNVDVAAGLAALAASGFIHRYIVDGHGYVEILNFAKHQNPHKKEAASSFPPPFGVEERCAAKAVEFPVQAPEIPVQAGLIPDSPFLIPDSSVADATAVCTAAVETVPIDPVWGTGLGFLRRKGVPEKQARSLLGKLRQTAGDVELGALLYRAEAEDISDPVPWLMAAASKARQRAGPHSGAGPPQASKTLTAIQKLQGMKHGNLDQQRNSGRAEQAALPGPGPDAGLGFDRGYGRNVG